MRDVYSGLRQQMLNEITLHATLVSDRIGKDVLDKRVTAAISTVPRHEFVPFELQAYAYADTPLPIGSDKTISQPFIVALMTDLLDVDADDVILEIGTGLGYQAAVLAQLAKQVYTVEIVEELGTQARQRLDQLGYSNVEVRLGNGYYGWPEHAPFDKLIVTAAPDLIPPIILGQLKSGGKMVIPTGLEESQQLILVEKDEDNHITTKEILAVRFAQLETDNSELGTC